MSNKDYKYNGKIINSILCEYGNVNSLFSAEKHYSNAVDYMKYFLVINELTKDENNHQFEKYIHNLVSSVGNNATLDEILDSHFNASNISRTLSFIGSSCPEIIDVIKSGMDSLDYPNVEGSDRFPQHFIQDVKAANYFDYIFPDQEREDIRLRLEKILNIKTKEPLSEYNRDEMARFASPLLVRGEYPNPAFPKNNASSLIENEKVVYVVTAFKNKLCSALSNYSPSHENLSRGDKSVLFNLLKSDKYRVVSPKGNIMYLQDGEEFSTDGKRNWRVVSDANNNLRMFAIQKFDVSNIKKDDSGSYKIENSNSDGIMVSVPEYKGGRIEIGDEVFIEGMDRSAYIELSEDGNIQAVTRDNEFTILTGSSVNSQLWAKRGNRGEFSIYKENGNGLVGHFTTNMTEKRKQGKNGKSFHLCQLDKEHSNLIVNINGKQESVSLKEKEKEYQLLIYKEIERQGFVCHFNLKTPDNKDMSGIKGVIYPAKGNQPIKFTEKGPDGVYYNTASFFKSNGNSVKGVIRDINDAMYMAELSRKPKELQDLIKEKTEKLTAMSKELQKAGLDPDEDQDYCDLEDQIIDIKGELDQHNRVYTKEKLKELNNQTWQAQHIYVLRDADFLIGKKENSYQRGYGN